MVGVSSGATAETDQQQNYVNRVRIAVSRGTGLDAKLPRPETHWPCDQLRKAKGMMGMTREEPTHDALWTHMWSFTVANGSSSPLNRLSNLLFLTCLPSTGWLS